MIYEIVNRRYRVCALLYDKDFILSCPAWDFLKEQAKSNSGQVAVLKKYFERYADDARAKLTTDILHHANKELEILQFIKGQMRLYCFIDGSSIILTHGALKKTQKADISEVNEAARCRKLYLQWKGNPK